MEVKVKSIRSWQLHAYAGCVRCHIFIMILLLNFLIQLRNSIRRIIKHNNNYYVARLLIGKVLWSSPWYFISWYCAIVLNMVYSTWQLNTQRKPSNPFNCQCKVAFARLCSFCFWSGYSWKLEGISWITGRGMTNNMSNYEKILLAIFILRLLFCDSAHWMMGGLVVDNKAK